MVEAEIHALSSLALYRVKWPTFCPGTLQPFPITQKAGATGYIKMWKKIISLQPQNDPCFHIQGRSLTLTEISRLLPDPITSLFNPSTL
jgi:hypothetical protein